MRKSIYVLMLASATLLFQACGGPAKDAQENADSLNKTKDTTSNVLNTGGIAADSEDAKFATEAADGGMAEVALGKLALSKTSHADIKSFANMMVTDHGKANEELMTVAKEKNITLPAAVDADHRAKADELTKLNGKEFDKAYVDAMVDGHQHTLDLMENEAKNGSDADLKAFAAKTAPVVKTHLEMIKKIQAGLK